MVASSSPVLRRSWFWFAFIALSALCAWGSARLFPHAFPLISIKIEMDRSEALRSARALAAAHGWGPTGAVHDTASFGSSDAEQSFIELEGGGPGAFADLLRDDLYSPYAWSVRLFEESETRQVVVDFKPSGAPYGFDETLRENAPGSALAAAAAREIAERSARAAPWNLPLDRFQLVESSQVARPGGRVDHIFVYERSDRSVGEGRLRLRLEVGGDRLIELTHFLKIPEAFSRRFEEMRSANNAIAAAASIIAMIGFLLVGGGLAFAYLARQRALIWRPPLAWAGVIAGLILLSEINAWPLVWLGYDTADSLGSFVLNRLAMMLVSAAGMGFVFFVSFFAAEGLSRRAFPHHPQFWRLWSREAGPTREVLGRTLGGYLFTSISLLYVLAFYYLAVRHLEWWTPSEALVDPNALAHLWPWLTPLARSAQAGFWEETLFRAVPLAGAALLGSRFGGRRLWIAAAFVLQALVFAAAHANYPGQPAYSRVVELILPSFIFGALYLRFGLLPAILLHFTFDVVLMSLPLFAASGDGIWLDRALVILVSLAPLWIVLWRRWQAGAWRELSPTLRNAAWQPPTAEPAPVPPPTSTPVPSTLSACTQIAVVLLAALALAAWFAASPFVRFGPPLEIGRHEAIAAAKAELGRRGIELPATFRAFASVAGRPASADRFVWRTAGREEYAQLVGRYLPEARWVVRFATFEGDIAERAEEWRVFLDGAGRVRRVTHDLPESRPGATLSEAEARERARAALRERWNADPTAFPEVSATSQKRPHRTDWTFVFKDPAVSSLAPGEARLRVTIAGDEVADAVRLVFVPEDWERTERALDSRIRIGRIARSVAIAGLVLGGVVLAIMAWSRGQFSVRVGLGTAGLVLLSTLVLAANHWPATEIHFSTAQPLSLQRGIAIGAPVVGGLVSAAVFGLVAGFLVRRLRPPATPPRRSVLVGGSLGVVLAGGFALAAMAGIGAAPPWPELDAAGTFSPFLFAVFDVLPTVVTQSAIFLLLLVLLDRWAPRGKSRIASGLVAFLAFALFALPSESSDLASWFASAAIGGGALTLAYFLVLRHDFTLVPLAIATGESLEFLAHNFPGGYAGAPAVACVGAALYLLTGWWVMRLLRRAGAASTPPPAPASTP